VITVKGVNNFLMGVAFYGVQVNLSSDPHV